MPNSVGKTNKQVRKFLRENGVKPSQANVERIGREIRRTEAENERVQRVARETGQGGLRDAQGRDVVRRRTDRIFRRANDVL